MATYNHVAYVRDAIESVKKNAEFVPLELWIVDDGSTDGTVEYLRTIDEDFIHISYNPVNTGAGAAFNAAMSKGSAEFIAIINSDDVWHPQKLKKQLQAYENGYGDTIFSLAEYVDHNGAILENGWGSYTPDTFRTNDDWKREDWLKMVCFGMNCLCTPSFLGLRSALTRVGGYDNRYRQIPDIELWSRLFQTQRPFVCPEKLMQFRLHPENTSRSSQESQKRHAFEAKMMMKEVFFGMTKDILHSNFDVREGVNIPIFDQLIKIISRGNFYGFQLALELIHENLHTRRYVSNITALDLHRISGNY